VDDEIRKEIGKIREKRKTAREAYYNLSPVISNSEYDALGERLMELSPDDEDFAIVGAPPPKLSVWQKIRHEIPMGSLDKVNTEDELVKWIEKIKASEFLITHKIDGSSMELVYSEGRLIRCVTRGDGTIGEDVTTNMVQVPGIPKNIPIVHEDVVIRGEVVMMKATFEEKYAEKYANPRNTAARKVRDKKRAGADCANLSLLAYTIISQSAPKKESQRFKILSRMGFSVP